MFFCSNHIGGLLSAHRGEKLFNLSICVRLSLPLPGSMASAELPVYSSASNSNLINESLRLRTLGECLSVLADSAIYFIDTQFLNVIVT